MITLSIKKLIIGIVVIVLLGVGGYYAYSYKKTSGIAQPNSEEKTPQKPLIDVSTLKYTQTYTVPEYGITFNYPEGFTVGEVEEGEGDAIVVQTPDGKVGVQISIQPSQEKATNITIDDVKESLPELTIKESQPVEIGEGGKGVAFIADGTNFGTSREVWFIFQKNMYQLSINILYDDILRNILNSWEFNTQ